MARIIIAAVAGAIVYFIWGMAAWMIVPLHGPTIAGLPNEQAVIDALQGQELESGVYVAPFVEDMAQMSDPESAFMKRHTAGPIMSIYYRRDGSQPMNTNMLGAGFGLDILASLLAACLLSCIGPCGQSYWCRVVFVATLGVFVAVVGHLSYWNWMYFPWDYTAAFVIDSIVGWTLAGLVIAAIVKPAAKSDSISAGAVVPAPVATPAAKAPQQAAPVRNDAISLLATLQREARFVDIVKEPLDEYSDAQVGAAARDVLRDCGEVLDRLFKLQSVVQHEDGAQIDIPSGAAAAQFRLTGNATDQAKSGSLVHHGWKAQKCELPKWSGSKDAALIVAPAELEVK